jgi:hypothetical protein
MFALLSLFAFALADLGAQGSKIGVSLPIHSTPGSTTRHSFKINKDAFRDALRVFRVGKTELGKAPNNGATELGTWVGSLA